MDTVTHTLFGLGLYNSVKKEQLSRREKQALFFTSIIGSQIPDIDIVSQLWDSKGLYHSKVIRLVCFSCKDKVLRISLFSTFVVTSTVIHTTNYMNNKNNNRKLELK